MTAKLYDDTVLKAATLSSYKVRRISNPDDKERMLRVLASGLIKKARLSSEAESLIERSFNFISQKESGGLYVPGSSQSMTWIVHYLEGRIGKEEAAWSKMGEQDAGALAPLNLTSSRIVTFYDAPNKSRMNLRFSLGLLYRPSWLENVHPTEYIQLAALMTLPEFILNDDTHKSLWVNWDSERMSMAGQKNWKPIRFTVEINSFPWNEIETWEI